ncbi:hypothetical protein SPRG_14419 [Saprolegnia parasitica CBS 223.65]|uniref:CCDC66 domain-containing protein n=1 Tax=Saprolegnia parasitica (strain CBS 223.65) TaxID=695850 RepID=A0A067BP82_SAPPC|nr:hypothetical protein SPRG_14419 [Saprolegnia parasitica CBS 223.65]KDO20284.1 hypothetical protein SPRG_14419 [Saprolegnia parasitica CBS 223.65]|eukprot:XP_012209022.1 hypothetical protein SPRG_14419 [Saprolegnia parasitica CBS 223.65]
MAAEDRGGPWSAEAWQAGRDYAGYEDKTTASQRASSERQASASPVYEDESYRRPSATSVRRFQLHEPDERLERMHRQQDKLRFRQMLDEQLEEKHARKAKEDAARKKEEAPQVEEELRYIQAQHMRAQQKLGHVATLRPPKFVPGAKFASAGGTTALPAPLPDPPTTKTNLTIQTVMPPPAPSYKQSSPARSTSYHQASSTYRPPTSPYRPASVARPMTPSLPSSHARSGNEHSREMLSEVQALLDEIRFERLQLRQEREVIALERQRLADETERFLSLQRSAPSPVYDQRPTSWTQFDAHTLSPTASHSPHNWSPYRSTRDAVQAPSPRRHRFFQDNEPSYPQTLAQADEDEDETELGNPLEQSLCCDSTFVPIDKPLSTFVPPRVSTQPAPVVLAKPSSISPLSSIDENDHNRKVIQTSGKYNWDVADAVVPRRSAARKPITSSSSSSSSSSSADPSQLFQVKVLV